MSSAEEIVLDDGTIHDDIIPSPFISRETTVAVGAGTTAITEEMALNQFSVSSKVVNLGSVSSGTTIDSVGYCQSGYKIYMSNFTAYTNGQKLNIPKGSTNLSFAVTNISYRLRAYNDAGAKIYDKTLSPNDFLCSSVRVTYSDGSYEAFNNVGCLTQSSTGLLSFTYTVPEVQREIIQIAFCAWVNIGKLTGLYNNSSFNDNYQVSITLCADNFKYSVDYEESTNSLLDNIIGWLSDIKDSIVNLPQLIWGYISDGLKSLFIPTEEEMTAIKTDWENLFRDRFGALYEAGEIISTFMDNFTYMGEQTTVDVPTVNINLAGTAFSFGGWTIDLVPSKFAFLVGMLKSVVSIICTLLFVNTLRNKFNKLVGDRT